MTNSSLFHLYKKGTLIQCRQALICLILFLTPVFSLFEVIALFNGTLLNQVNNLTPTCVKLIKDFIIISIIILGMLDCLLRGKILFFYSYSFFLLLCVTSVIFSFNEQPFLFIISGFRWLLWFLLLPFIYNVVDNAFQRKIAHILSVLFIFAFILQLFELRYLVGWYGLNKLGLSRRNPGFFLIPLTMAAFVLLTFYYVNEYLHNGFLKKTVLFLVPFSMFLTGSGTGIIVYCLIAFIKVYKKIKQKGIVLFLIFFSSILLIILLPIISSRPDIYTSLFTRFILLDRYKQYVTQFRLHNTTIVGRVFRLADGSTRSQAAAPARHMAVVVRNEAGHPK